MVGSEWSCPCRGGLTRDKRKGKKAFSGGVEVAAYDPILRSAGASHGESALVQEVPRNRMEHSTKFSETGHFQCRLGVTVVPSSLYIIVQRQPPRDLNVVTDPCQPDHVLY